MSAALPPLTTPVRAPAGRGYDSRPPLPGRPGDVDAAAEALRHSISTKKEKDNFSLKPAALPWKSEAALPMLQPVHLFQALLDNESQFDLEWHKRNGDQDVTCEPWRHPQGELWGGQRMLSMQIKAGSLGQQPYREDQRYVYVLGDGGSSTLLWHRSGRLASPPVMVPKFRVECAYFFHWGAGGSLRCVTHSGMCGYNGWLRGRIEPDCKKDFHESQPKFEEYLRETVQAALTALSEVPMPDQVPYDQLLSSCKRVRSTRGLGHSRASTFYASCHSICDLGELEAPPEKQASIIVLPDSIPPDPALGELGVVVLCDLALRHRAVDEKRVEEFRRSLISGIVAADERNQHAREEAAAHAPAAPLPVEPYASPLAEGTLDATKPQVPQHSISHRSDGGQSAHTFVDCGDDAASTSVSVAAEHVLVSFAAPPAPPQDCLERICVGQVVDVADRLHVHRPDTERFRQELLTKLRQIRDRGSGAVQPRPAAPPAQGGAGPGAHHAQEVPPQRPKKGGGCCSCV
eukprot:TRINITY_DN6350_c0_g1_i1.p1 TRINITY_DN6350_c0_g1~~TRINITY_DN6350_c0_g1_i1.p1  ORF type:complete len:518 (+),score=119.20 TRINITY_DN6350_c0_g1_i1:89-1642(+)